MVSRALIYGGYPHQIRFTGFRRTRGRNGRGLTAPPCRIRALLHPAPLFIFAIVLALLAGGGCVYPLYRFHIHSTQKGSLGEALFFDGTIISCKSCFIVLTFTGLCDLSAAPRHAAPKPLPNPATHASAAPLSPSTRFSPRRTPHT